MSWSFLLACTDVQNLGFSRLLPPAVCFRQSILTFCVKSRTVVRCYMFNVVLSSFRYTLRRMDKKNKTKKKNNFSLVKNHGINGPHKQFKSIQYTDFVRTIKYEVTCFCCQFQFAVKTGSQIKNPEGHFAFFVHSGDIWLPSLLWVPKSAVESVPVAYRNVYFLQLINYWGSLIHILSLPFWTDDGNSAQIMPCHTRVGSLCAYKLKLTTSNVTSWRVAHLVKLLLLRLRLVRVTPSSWRCLMLLGTTLKTEQSSVVLLRPKVSLELFLCRDRWCQVITLMCWLRSVQTKYKWADIWWFTDASMYSRWVCSSKRFVFCVSIGGRRFPHNKRTDLWGCSLWEDQELMNCRRWSLVELQTHQTDLQQNFENSFDSQHAVCGRKQTPRELFRHEQVRFVSAKAERPRPSRHVTNVMWSHDTVTQRGGGPALWGGGGSTIPLKHTPRDLRFSSYGFLFLQIDGNSLAVKTLTFYVNLKLINGWRTLVCVVWDDCGQILKQDWK